MFKRYSNDGNSAAKIYVDEFGNIRFRRGTYVSPELLEYCRREYEASKTRPAGDVLGNYVCLPDDLFFDWLQEGFDPAQEEPHVVCARLRAEGLGDLITNAKAELRQGA